MNEKLYREPSNYTPEIDFDPEKEKFKMAGISRPEDAYAFYEPILSWVEEYVNTVLEKSEQNKLSNDTFTILFDFKYMNSSSSKYIFQIISNFKKIYQKQLNVHVYWYYDDIDDQILEDGEDFSEIIGLNFNYVTRDTEN